jgi:hypothetical protein
MNAFVSENLFEYMNSTRDDFLREALTMLCFGFSLFEKVYEMKEDKIVLKKLAFRKQTTVFRRETSDGKAGITQLLPSSKETGGENQ